MLPDVQGLRWGLLLILLLLAVFLAPLFGGSTLAELISLALFEFVVVAALITSVTHTRGRIIGAVVAALWFAATVAALLADAMHGFVAAFSAVMLAGALLVTFYNLLDREAGDLDALIGAVFGYILLAMTWAMLFVQIERWHPGSFEFPLDSDLWSSLIYFSLITLTTLGYGDILPIAPVARLTAGLEAVVGVLYIAVMIGNIVGTYRRRVNKL
ncbi:MAG: hypothetical protein MnENMB40S_27430 [Rhizobiaceae bacterium MnEN-MB40S]|nr:MAG: hypothetical protein MnENMB40S_27430 [Rhizobiaceae bacterium MnEN-MB40S]